VLNKTQKVTITTATARYTTYTYDAGGTLLRKQQFDNSALKKTTDYIDGFVYEDTNLAYFGTPEGRMRNAGGTLKSEYTITDQQGNARISFEDNGGTAKVIQENSYYAFGLVMPGSVVATPTVPNKKLYNGGSEWQNDFSNLPDYYQTSFRNYDAALGRWTGVDPDPESAESLTTYQYAGNNPVMFNDPMGDKPKAVSEPAPKYYNAFGEGG
jgi:RHS repeat-associated protein